MATTPDLSYLIGLPPKEAIEFLQRKGYRISWNWQETLQQAHARAFTVAKVARLDVLNDIRQGVEKALAEGRTERWFQKELTQTLQEKGWWGKRQVEVKPGESREIQLGSPSRLRLIYRQNLQSAYMAGRWKQQQEISKSRPYLMYVAVLDQKTRPAHREMSGRVFRADDPIWQSHYPPNGWNCRCRVRALSDSALKKKGLEVDSSAGQIRTKTVDAGVDRLDGEITRTEVTGLRLTGRDGKPTTFFTDAGFSYNPGRAAWQPDLEKYPESIARQYVEGMITGPDFARFFKGETGGTFPVGVLRELDREALKTATQSVKLSDESLRKNLKEHPEMTLADYQRIPDILDRGEVYQQGDERLIFLRAGDKLYRAAVKVTKDGTQNYFLSLFKTSDTLAAQQVRSRLEKLR